MTRGWRLLGYGAFAGIVGLLALTVLPDSFFLPTPPPSATSSAFLMSQASRLNKTVPFMVDKETELTTTIGSEGQFLYKYRLVNMVVDQVDVGELMNELKKQAKSGACSIPVTRELLKAGVTMRYSYSDKNFVYIGDFRITPPDCAF